MEKLLQLTVADADGVKLDVQAQSVRMASPNGAFGVLPGHAPMLAVIRPGPVSYRTAEGDHVFTTSGGIADIQAGSITILE